MMNAFRAEWVKLRRRPTLFGGLGAMAGSAALATVITVRSATGSAGGSAARRGFGALSSADLTAADGLASVLASGAMLVGVVVLCLVAASVAADFSHGTLRGQLIRQPRRLRLLAGKYLAHLSFVAAGVGLATVTATGLAALTASTGGLDTGAWWSSAGLAAVAEGAANLLAAAVGYATIGALLALVLRSPAAAVGVAVAWLLPFEQLLSAAVPDVARLLPGQLLSALAAGGNATVSYLAAMGTLSALAAIALPAAAMTFVRRDLTT